MLKKVLLGVAVAAFAGGFISTPALAGHCPKDAKKITAAAATMDKTKMSIAKEGAAKGLALHKAGKHGESLKALHAVMKSLSIKH